MEDPVDEKLKIKLEVDAKLGDSWYECKWKIRVNKLLKLNKE